MSIDDPNVVDLVGQDASGRVVVIMIESREWGVEESQAAQLKEKINAYAEFIVSGALVQRFPEAGGRSSAIQLNCREAPTGEFATIVAHATTELERVGIGFLVHVTSDNAGG